MAKKKIAQANTETLEVAQKVAAKKKRELPFYYQYTYPDGKVIFLDQFEWAGGYSISHREVKKAQAARKREVKNGYATTKEA